MKGTGELVLYLDYDGVLHHDNVLVSPSIGPYLVAPEGYTLFQHAQLLEALLAPYPHLQIVLSTTWVARYGCVQAAKHLRPALRARVVGATFHPRWSAIKRGDYWDAPRGMQVLSDVLRRKPRDWLALDDDWRHWPTNCLEKYVRTHAHAGLSDPAVEREFREKLQEMCK